VAFNKFVKAQGVKRYIPKKKKKKKKEIDPNVDHLVTHSQVDPHVIFLKKKN
jgi:hypothetical protein